MAEHKYDPSKQTWQEFIAETRIRSAAYADDQGRKEARVIFGESPAEAKSLADSWSKTVSGMGEGMDKAQVLGFIEEVQKLSAEQKE